MRFQTNGAAVSGIVTRKERVHLRAIAEFTFYSANLPLPPPLPSPPPIEIRRNDGSCPQECFRPRPPIAHRGIGVAGRKIRRGRKSVGNRHFLREPSLHAAQGGGEGVNACITLRIELFSSWGGDRTTGPGKNIARTGKCRDSSCKSDLSLPFLRSFIC